MPKGNVLSQYGPTQLEYDFGTFSCRQTVASPTSVVFDNGGDCIRLTFEQCRQLADWIQGTVPNPAEE